MTISLHCFITEAVLVLWGFKMICRISPALAVLAIITLAGCSSIIEGRSPEITINTNPPDASCTLVRNNLPIGTVSPTPSSILVEKTKYDITIKCDKDGYQEATYFNKSGVAGATFGNIVLGGGIGWAIDSAEGADNKYDSPVNITLVPEEAKRASRAPAKHHHHTSVAASLSSSTPPNSQAEANSDSSQSDFPTDKNGGR